MIYDAITQSISWIYSLELKHNSHALTEITNEHIKTKQLQLSNITKLGPDIHEHFCF
jgi:hypothetical protein